MSYPVITLDHVGIVVPDLHAATRLYNELCHWRVREKRSAVAAHRAGQQVAFLECGAGLTLELIGPAKTPLAGPNIAASFHLGLATDDIITFQRVCDRIGIPTAWSFDANGHRLSLTATTHDGTILEAFQRSSCTRGSSR